MLLSAMNNWANQRPVFLGYSESVQALQGELLRACGYSGLVQYLLNVEVERVGIETAVDGIDLKFLSFNHYEPEGADQYGFAVATPAVKHKLFDLLRTTFGIEMDRYMTLVDPSSNLAPSVALERGVQIEQSCIFASYSRVGFGATVKRGSNVGHHTVIEDYARLNPGVTLSGGCRVGRGATLGVGATVIDGIEIGAGAIIGAGSVVTKSIPENVVAYGNPCRVIRKIA